MSTLPANEVATPCESSAERERQNEISLLESPFGDRLRHTDRNRSGGRISIPLYIVEDLLRRESELRSHHLIDTEVRLMGNDQVDLLRRYPVSL